MQPGGPVGRAGGDRGPARFPHLGAGDTPENLPTRLNYPAATGVDGAGNPLIVDDDNGRVREVNGSAPKSNR